MRDKILKLLKLSNKPTEWAATFTELIQSNDTHLLSNTPGSYSASDLLAELKIRAGSATRAGITVVGIVELMEQIKPHKGVIVNYIFKDRDRTGIVYLDDARTKVIGAVVINHQT